MGKKKIYIILPKIKISTVINTYYTNMETRRMNRWYFGGLSATSAAVCTHPLDLLKTVVQTPNVKAAKAVAQSKACHSTIFYAYSAQGYKINPAPAFAGAVVAEQRVKLGL